MAERVDSAVDAYQKYAPALVRKARRILQNEDDASDVVHALFVDLLQEKPRALDLPYLYRAITNRCLNAMRDRNNRQQLLERQQPALRGPVRSRLDDRVIDLDLLARLTERLDSKTMETMVCLYVDDLSQEETATLLGTSRRTVGKRLKKARRALSSIADVQEKAS